MRPFDARVLEERSHLLRMEGTRLFKAAVRTMAQQAQAALDAAGVAKEEVGLVVPHQANLRIIEGLIREMSLDPARVYVNIGRYGNTGAATIPIALDEAVRAGRRTRARPILLVSFGAGATAGAAVLGDPPIHTRGAHAVHRRPGPCSRPARRVRPARRARARAAGADRHAHRRADASSSASPVCHCMTMCLVRNGRLEEIPIRFNSRTGDTLTVDSLPISQVMPLTGEYASVAGWFVENEPSPSAASAT